MSSNNHTSDHRIRRRRFLKGAGVAGASISIGMPSFESMFNSAGTAYAAEDAKPQPIEKRFVLWFNGNGIIEKYWIPRQEGDQFEMTPCLQPLARFRNDIHILSGVDNPAARVGAGNGHHNSMSGLVSGESFTGRGAGGPSIDQAIAQHIGGDSRFRSLQIGVCQESFGESIQRNMSWAGRDRPLPPEMIPHQLFNRLFGAKDEYWTERKKSVLDAVTEDATALKRDLGYNDLQRLEEYLSSVRSLERSIAGLSPEYTRVVEQPPEGGDLKDWPRIAKLQTDLLVHALASRQTRVASYMLTKCQGLSRFPWLGYTYERHHEYTHGRVESPEGQRTMRDICRWHVEEFAYFIAKLKSIPEGEGTLLDHTCALFIHEHAECNSHKNAGLAMIAAGHAGGMKTGRHTRVTGTIGDLYWTIAEEAIGARIGNFPSATKKLSQII